jgi:uncharacterized protein (DUF1499 family)
MKIAIIIIVSLIIVAILALFVLGQMSQSGEANGLVEAKLTKCPDKPNCICTEFEADATHYIDPIVFTQSNGAEILSRIKNSVREMGGRIQAEADNYLAFTFTSSIFRFVDDLEIRIDADQNMIHMRSASRVGRSDRGVNKKRIEQLKKLFHSKEPLINS